MRSDMQKGKTCCLPACLSPVRHPHNPLAPHRAAYNSERVLRAGWKRLAFPVKFRPNLSVSTRRRPFPNGHGAGVDPPLTST